MGSRASSLFPTSIVVCDSATAASTAVKAADALTSARYDYACTTSGAIRTGLTSLHLLLMVLAFFLTAALYVIFLRISSRREAGRLLAMPERRMPLYSMSRAMMKKVVAAQARIASDDVVPQPSKGNAIDGALAYGTRSNHYVYVVGIANDLMAFAHEAVAAEPRLRGLATVAQLPSLRSAADLLIDLFNVTPEDLWPVIILAERAAALGALADPTADEFQEYRDRVWRIMRALESGIAAAAESASAATLPAATARRPVEGAGSSDRAQWRLTEQLHSSWVPETDVAAAGADADMGTAGDPPPSTSPAAPEAATAAGTGLGPT